MPHCVLCGCEIDGTNGVVEHMLTVPVVKCHACADDFRAEFIRWLRRLSVERGMTRGEPGKALAQFAPLDFGPVS